MVGAQLGYQFSATICYCTIQCVLSVDQVIDYVHHLDIQEYGMSVSYVKSWGLL